MASPLHIVRFKGVTVGKLTGAQIAERLREGELSLAHAVEHRGRWMTLRQFLRETAQPVVMATPPAPATGLLGRLGRRASSAAGTDEPPPPPGAGLVGESIELRVREGYLWCGLTFALPLALGLPVWLLCAAAGARPAQLLTLLVVSNLLGAGYAGWRAHRSADSLHREGLEDVGRSLRQLAVALAAASALFWIAVTWAWVRR